MNFRRKAALLAAFVGLSALPAMAQDVPVLKLSAATSGDPSAWAIAIIEKQGLDLKHGFDLQTTSKPVSVAYTDFVSGADPLCLCLTIGTGARFLIEGVDVSLVWTYQSYNDAFLITTNPEIQSAKDLPGHSLAGSTGSGSWIFNQYFLTQHQGVDLTKVEIPSIKASAQVTHLAANRVDAITGYDATKVRLELLEPGRYRFIKIFDQEKWQETTGIDYVPMFLMGLRTGWYQDPANAELLKKLYAAYSEAITYIYANPDKAAAEIGETDGHAPVEFIAAYLKQFPDSGTPTLSREYRGAVRALTQDILPPTGLIDRPLTDAEVEGFVLDFTP